MLTAKRLLVWLGTAKMTTRHRTSCWRRAEVGSCKQGGQKNGLGEVLRYYKITKPYIFQQSSRQSSLLGSKRE